MTGRSAGSSMVDDAFNRAHLSEGRNGAVYARPLSSFDGEKGKVAAQDRAPVAGSAMDRYPAHRDAGPICWPR